jgi:hypothetical protein
MPVALVLALGCDPLRSLPGAGEAAARTAAAPRSSWPATRTSGLGSFSRVMATAGAGAQRQGGLALLDGLVALGVAGVGGDAELRVEPVEGVLVEGGRGLEKGAGAAGLGVVV